MFLFAVILTIAITIAVSLIIVSLYHYRKQINTENLPLSFKEAAAAFNLSIAKQEILGNRMIGLDERSKKLLFLQAHGNKHNGYLVDLNEIKACVVKKEYGVIHEESLDGSSLESYINGIALQFDYKNGANPTFLTFYDRSTNLESEMRKRAEQAKVWQDLLSARLAGTLGKVEKRTVPAKRTYASIIEEAAPLLRGAENTTSYHIRHSSFSL